MRTSRCMLSRRSRVGIRIRLSLRRVRPHPLTRRLSRPNARLLHRYNRLSLPLPIPPITRRLHRRSSILFNTRLRILLQNRYDLWKYGTFSNSDVFSDTDLDALFC